MVNLSERLAKAAMERCRQPEASAQRVPVTSIESHPSFAPLPDRIAGPVDAGRVVVMKMRLPEPTNPETTTESSTGLPLWQRPFVDVMREAGLATVTSLPIQPRGDETIDNDVDDCELAQTIPMPGVRMSEPVIDIERYELHLPRLAMSEAVNLASVTLRFDSDPLADPDQSHAMGDITFGPIDLRDEITSPIEASAPLPRADAEHTCPQCGAVANRDIHDPMRGRVHLSCDCCFKMWQVRVEATVHSDEPFMRD